MEQYIPKDAVVAEIENLLDKGRYHEEYDCAYRDGNNGALYALKSKLNTLEVKEADLKEEIDKFWKPRFSLGWDDKSLLSVSYKGFESIAKHFFELGLKAKKCVKN